MSEALSQDERLEAIVKRMERTEPLEETPIPKELAQPKSFLKVLKANHYNWSSPHFRKIFAMRFSVKIPPLEQLNAIFYPRENYDVPVFIFFCLLTKRKVIVHLNLNCPFEDAAYRARWVDPLVSILNRYRPFESKDRYPEWMKKYRNDCTIYGLFARDRLDDLSNICFDYLDHYAEQVSQSGEIVEPDRLARICNFHDQWVSDIRTQDKAQGMIAKMIGAKTAQRIFYEVTT